MPLHPIITLGAVVALLCGLWAVTRDRTSIDCAIQALTAAGRERPYEVVRNGARSLSFTPEQLQLFAGQTSRTTCLAVVDPSVESDTTAFLLLVVLGEVYDVSTGGRFYRSPSIPSNSNRDEGQPPSLGYHIFVGQDSSASFATGTFFNPPQPDVRQLSDSHLESVLEWRGFYRNHSSYAFVGTVEGLYYDNMGEPTDILRAVEIRAHLAKQRRESEQLQLQQIPTCDSSYVPAEKRSRLWCSNIGGQEPRRVRRLRWVSSSSSSVRGAEAASPSERCACLTALDESQLTRRSEGGSPPPLGKQHQSAMMEISWEPYTGCEDIAPESVCILHVA